MSRFSSPSSRRLKRHLETKVSVGGWNERAPGDHHAARPGAEADVKYITGQGPGEPCWPEPLSLQRVRAGPRGAGASGLNCSFTATNSVAAIRGISTGEGGCCRITASTSAAGTKKVLLRSDRDGEGGGLEATRWSRSLFFQSGCDDSLDPLLLLPCFWIKSTKTVRTPPVPPHGHVTAQPESNYKVGGCFIGTLSCHGCDHKSVYI